MVSSIAWAVSLRGVYFTPRTFSAFLPEKTRAEEGSTLVPGLPFGMDEDGLSERRASVNSAEVEIRRMRW